MKTRAYNIETRLRQQAALKASIAAATVELHAAKGAIATSYADIAKYAGVSLPTVYKHFPTLNELLQGCTSHVIAKAPQFPADEILAAPDLPAAAELLAAAMEQQHLHYEPWFTWREDRVIPFLAELSEGFRKMQSAFLTKLLAQHLGKGVRREMVAGWESALSFDLWHRLVRSHGLPRPAARRVLVHCLLAVIEPTPASTKTGSRRKP
ncbi:MAG: TetR/AcrR family transcriptional regulator [Gallionellaceae bacterium]